MPENSLSLSVMWGNSEEVCSGLPCRGPGRSLSPEAAHVCTLVSDFCPPELWENGFLWLKDHPEKLLSCQFWRPARVPAVLLFTYSFHLSPHCAFWTCFVASGNNSCPFCTLECDTHRVSEKFLEECFVWGSWSFGYVVSVRTSGVSPKPLLSIKEEG